MGFMASLHRLRRLRVEGQQAEAADGAIQAPHQVHPAPQRTLGAAQQRAAWRWAPGDLIGGPWTNLIGAPGCWWGFTLLFLNGGVAYCPELFNIMCSS